MSLNANQRGFVEVMTKSEESADDGFTILAKRADAPIFFDTLEEAGLFDASKVKGPVPAEREGFVRLPYWFGLDYIEAIARTAGATNDKALADKIAKLIIRFSRNANDEQRQNYHTWRKFAEAVSSLPLPAITKSLIDELKLWLSSTLDRSLVAEALGNRLLPRLIASDDLSYRILALELFGHLTGLRKIKKRGREDQEPEPDTEVESYWVNSILEKNLSAFAKVEPGATADLFRARVREVFTGTRERSSWLYRPAVEDHAQNMDWNAAENYSVKGLRDVMAAWLEQQPKAAADYVVRLFGDGGEMERRIAVWALDAHFEIMRARLGDFGVPALLNVGLIHETYNLLLHRALAFPAEALDRIFEFISALNVPTEDEEERARNRRLQRKWLSALKGAGVDRGIADYNAVAALVGPEGSHPDFLSYHESSTGPGPSPYTKAELLQFLLDGVLIEKLNAFVESNVWRGTTKRALCDTLEEAIVESPEEFLPARSAFLGAARAYQHSYLAAYLRLWGNEKSKPTNIPWQSAWPALLDWILTIIEPEAFWTEEPEQNIHLAPNRTWIVHQVAETVQSGTRDDARAFDPILIPKLHRMVQLLMSRLEPEKLASEAGAVNNVINTSRGKAIEALFNLALRTCRLADRDGNGHQAAWDRDIKPLFDAEMARLPTGNDEFVVLFGHYVAHLQYIDEGWLRQNIGTIFKDGSRDFRLALAGMVFAPSTRPLYGLLIEAHIVDMALALEDGEDSGRDRLIQRLALGILWGDESLDGDRFQSLFSPTHVAGLSEVANFFWTARREQLTALQLDLVREFWRRASDWAKDNKSSVGELTGKLLSLVCYFDTMTPPDQSRLLWLIQNSSSEDHAWFLAEDLNRLADADPVFIGHAMLAYIEATKPYYDHDKHLLSATKKLRDAGHPDVAQEIANRLRKLPEFKALFMEMRGS
jgi:hypothetical protein